MPMELICTSCNTKSIFDDDAASDGAVECPKCGSTIRVDGGDELSETMRVDLDE